MFLLNFARAVALLLLLTVHSLVVPAAQGIRIEGVVSDQFGAPVAGAEVRLSGGSFFAIEITDGEGRFLFESVEVSGGRLMIKADGFGAYERNWSASDAADGHLNIRLTVAPITGSITVTPGRTETLISDTPASVILLSSEELATTPALTLDDSLRQVPGFSLFRRSGSRTTNPTAQGVSLRGVGASGASRAAVLADGIPINDPFGGWVYWGRVPRQSIDRVEVFRGGASSLYGTDALGGVVNILTRPPSDPALAFEASYGNQETADGSFSAGGRIGQMGARLSAELFRTEGYILVDEDERGRVDTPAGARFSSFDLLLERMVSETWRVSLNGSLFGEARENGTPLQKNRTHIRQFVLGSDWRSDRAGSVDLKLFTSTQAFDQDFSAISADRNSESLTRSQRVPAQQIGLSAQWARTAGSSHTLVAGLEAREVRGASDELAFAGGRLVSATGAGGRERILGIFGQDIIRIGPRLLVTASGRYDRWRNYDALSTTQPLVQPGPTVVTEFADRTEEAFSPRLSILGRINDNVSVIASGYRAFRAPTLNELYRSFRVGNIITLANENLRAERLTGGETGLTVSGFNRRVNARGIFFWSETTRTVANVTLAFAPELIIRQRENLGRTRSRGFEADIDARVSQSFSISAGYQYVDATVVEFPANRTLEGLQIPQVPKHQFTFQARYIDSSKLMVGVFGRAISEQFDDDRNQLDLRPYFALDAMVSRPLKGGLEAFIAVENLLNRRYDIGRTPVRTIGPPALVRAGIRFRVGGG